MPILSIHDTHRLPFPNATITAKRLSQSTEPVRFQTYTGETLGFEVKTNAGGYLCRSDGTPYSDGVFVPEAAVVTATFAGGSSTSWTVGPESEITIYDGILYGREIVESDSEEDRKNAVSVGGVLRKRLFSANQQGDSELSFDDLANLPSFSKWTDDQQIERLDLANYASGLTVNVGIQTKVLILMAKDGTSFPGYPNVVAVNLQATLDSEYKTRFGRNMTIFNLTGGRVSLRNIDWEVPIGGVENGCCLEVAETYPNAVSDSTDGGRACYVAADNGAHASLGGRIGTTTADILRVNDSTPDILRLSYVAASSDTSFDTQIMLDTDELTRSRSITIARQDSFAGSMTLYVQPTVGGTKTFVCSVPPYGVANLLVTSGGALLLSDVRRGVAAMALYQYKTTLTTYLVPANCGMVSVNVPKPETAIQTREAYRLAFSNFDSGSTRLEFNNPGPPRWFDILLWSGMGYNDAIKNGNSSFVSFCIPSGTSRVTVENVMGVVRILEKSWDREASITASYNGENRWYYGNGTYDIEVDWDLLDRHTSRDFLDTGNDRKSKLDFIIPGLEDENDTAFVRLVLPSRARTTNMPDDLSSNSPMFQTVSEEGKEDEDGKVPIAYQQDGIGSNDNRLLRLVHQQTLKGTVTLLGGKLKWTDGWPSGE